MSICPPSLPPPFLLLLLFHSHSAVCILLRLVLLSPHDSLLTFNYREVTEQVPINTNISPKYIVACQSSSFSSSSPPSPFSLSLWLSLSLFLSLSLSLSLSSLCREIAADYSTGVSAPCHGRGWHPTRVSDPGGPYKGYLVLVPAEFDSTVTVTAAGWG